MAVGTVDTVGTVVTATAGSTLDVVGATVVDVVGAIVVTTTGVGTVNRPVAGRLSPAVFLAVTRYTYSPGAVGLATTHVVSVGFTGLHATPSNVIT